MSPAFWFFLGTLVGAAVCSTVETYIRRRIFDDLETSYRAESAEVDAFYKQQIAARDARLELIRRAIPKGTDRGVIRSTNKLRLAIGDEPWPGGEPCDCNPPCGEDVAPETTTPTRGPGCAEQ